jgi:hypothetical protein
MMRGAGTTAAACTQRDASCSTHGGEPVHDCTPALLLISCYYYVITALCVVWCRLLKRWQ